MAQRIIAEIDAAGTDFVDGARSPHLLAFVRDLTRFVAADDDAAARAALRSPFSGVPNVDARALAVAAGDGPIAAAIERDRVPLAHETTLAARRFARALDELATAYRAQGATVGEHVATIRLAFDLETTLDAAERATLDAIERCAAALDAARPAGEAWEGRTLIVALAALANAAPAETEPNARRAAEAVQRAPLARREPEAAAVVKRRRSHFSASSLGTYAECERRWYYRYVCAAVEDRGSSASFYGTAFHWALERFHEEFPRVDGVAHDALERKLDAYLGTAFERFRTGFDTPVEYELQRRRAKRTGRRYLAWLEERARKAPFAVVGTETSVELDLDGYTFVGYIDRLDRDDATGAITVIDYKTGSIAESAEAYREAVARFVDFQLPFYYWARTAAGDRVTRLALVPLKDASADVRPVELEVVPITVPRMYGDSPTGTIGIDELERARTKMIEIARALADGPIERFPATDDPEACAYCAYRNACRTRPLPREDRFGR
jgi:RecB family exonuclease